MKNPFRGLIARQFQRTLSRLNDIGFYNLHYAVQAASISVNIEINRFGKIQAEDTHDRLCVNDISSGYQIKVAVKFADFIYKCFHFIDRVQ